jgi:hypothetical protein
MPAFFMSMDGLYFARGHDCMDAGVRAKQEARAEESEATTSKIDCMPQAHRQAGTDRY